MMRAIAHSAPLVLAYSDRVGGNVEHDGYSPNPNGLYEVGGRICTAEGQRKLNKQPRVLVKVFFDYLCTIPRGNHKIVFMIRDPDEIKQSVARVSEHFKNLDREYERPWPINVKTFDRYRPYRQEDIDHVIGVMEARSDVKMVVVDYGDLVANPLSQMRRVQEVIPELRVEKAARLIDPKLHRMRSVDVA